MVMSVWDIYNLGINQTAELKDKSEIQNKAKPDSMKRVTAAPFSYSGDTQTTLIIVVV